MKKLKSIFLSMLALVILIYIPIKIYMFDVLTLSMRETLEELSNSVEQSIRYDIIMGCIILITLSIYLVVNNLLKEKEKNI